MAKTKAMLVVVVVMAMLSSSGTAFAQAGPVEPKKQSYNQMLGIAGLATIMTGALLMVPMEDPSATSYYVEGAGSYCADTNTPRQSVSVTKGGCDDLPPMITAGFVTMGVGAVMALIGFHKVQVSPQVGNKAVGAKVSLKW